VFGPRKRRLTAAAATVLLLLTAACADAEGSSSSEATAPDVAASDAGPERAVEQRWEAYWQARTASENSGELGDVFTSVARGKALESQTRRLRNYARQGLVRVGAPRFRDAEVRRMGTSAHVLACLDADDWTASVGERRRPAGTQGWEPTGSVLKQVRGTWFVVDELSPQDVADMGKTCGPDAAGSAIDYENLVAGTAARTARTCTFRGPFDDTCLGESACWVNDPAAVQDPEGRTDEERPKRDDHLVFMACVTASGDQWSRWYWKSQGPATADR